MSKIKYTKNEHFFIGNHTYDVWLDDEKVGTVDRYDKGGYGRYAVEFWEFRAELDGKSVLFTNHLGERKAVKNRAETRRDATEYGIWYRNREIAYKLGAEAYKMFMVFSDDGMEPNEALAAVKAVMCRAKLGAG